jgi:hypothetical protein
MPSISDVSIINWNTTEAKPVPSGLERTICSEGLCGSKTLTVYQRTVLEGRQFGVNARDDYHLAYVFEAPKEGIITFNGKSRAAEEGAGVLSLTSSSRIKNFCTLPVTVMGKASTNLILRGIL